MSHTLFASLEDWSLEGDVNVDVNVGAPEDAAEAESQAAEVAAASSDVQAEEEKGEETADQAEQVANDAETAQMLMQHISTYGVDRATLFFYNSHGELSTSLHLPLPSYESFPAVGNPYSSTSIAVMEGLGERLKQAKDWVVKKFKQFIAWIDRMINAVVDYFNVWQKRAAGLFKEMKSRIDQPDKLKDLKEPKVFSYAYLTKAMADTKSYIQKINARTNEIRALLTKPGDIKSTMNAWKNDADTNGLKPDEEKLFSDDQKVVISEQACSFKQAAELLRLCDKVFKTDIPALRSQQKFLENTEKVVETALTKDEDNLKDKENDHRSMIISAVSKSFSALSSEVTRSLTIYRKLATYCYRTASARVEYGSKKTKED